MQRIVGRAATHGEWGVVAEGGFCEDALREYQQLLLRRVGPRLGG